MSRCLADSAWHSTTATDLGFVVVVWVEVGMISAFEVVRNLGTRWSAYLKMRSQRPPPGGHWHSSHAIGAILPRPGLRKRRDSCPQVAERPCTFPSERPSSETSAGRVLSYGWRQVLMRSGPSSPSQRTCTVSIRANRARLTTRSPRWAVARLKWWLGRWSSSGRRSGGVRGPTPETVFLVQLVGEDGRFFVRAKAVDLCTVM